MAPPLNTTGEIPFILNTLQASKQCSEMLGKSAAMNRISHLISLVSPTESTVLLTGETGTGKELVASAIHNNSLRNEKLMVKVNCATLPSNLIESELFGHERGSFTGAIEKRTGKFELANNSTLFLDEIGELPLLLQVKLLRALQEKEIERIGGRSVIKTNVRIIAATNRNLLKEVHNGNFRSDLYFRLNVFPITIPPLRERPEDIEVLVDHFLQKHGKKSGIAVTGVSQKAMQELLAWHWPGNVRELEHLIERSILLAQQSTITELNLPVAELEKTDKYLPGTKIKTIQEIERDHIMYVLKIVKGKISGSGGAAEILKVASTTLNSKIKRLGIKKEYVTV